MSGHCEHCADDCLDLPGGGGHRDADGCLWYTGRCPACAERERIVAAIEADSKALSDDGDEGWKRVGMLRAARIARGEK